MDAHADKTRENKSQSVANEISQKQNGRESTFQLVDNRVEAIAQRKLIELANNGPQVKQLMTFQEMANNSPRAKQAAQLQTIADDYSAQQQHPMQKKENETGLPDNLKTGIESLSGYSMDDVKVHYNSDKPAQLNAHAYAQGTDIHLASGQEKHLPHEAWHVVQQKQGRVKPIMQMTGKVNVNVNDDAGLEKEADVIGGKALNSVNLSAQQLKSFNLYTPPTIQAVFALSSTYRLSNSLTRNIHVDPGTFENKSLANNLNRAVLYETMVQLNGAKDMANRYNEETADFRNAVGLSVAINASYREEKEIKVAQDGLTKTATNIEQAVQSPINVVRVLWQDGRRDEKTDIRQEVPFAELRKCAAADKGSKNLYNYLKTGARTVWRKMGDDDMPFMNPNDDKIEVNQELARLERNNDEWDRGNLASFNYSLVPNTQDGTILRICNYIYRVEAEAIAAVIKDYGITVYAIEPTTYYRGQEGADAGEIWNNYETYSDPSNKQIKEGASFGKALKKKYGTLAEYIKLKGPMATSDGGRLKAVVGILEEFLNSKKEIDGKLLSERLSDALKNVDQSIWDKETLVRGAKWMCTTDDEKNSLYELTNGINKIIDEKFTVLLKEIVSGVVKQNGIRRGQGN